MGGVVDTPPVVHRGRPRSADADRAILEAAHELVIEDGFDGLTMAAVAQRAGVSTATLYRRFSDKVDLVTTVIDQLQPPRQPIDTGTLEGDLWAAMNGARQLAASPAGTLLGALAHQAARHPELVARIKATFADGPVGQLRAILERAVARREIPPLGDEDVAVSHLVGPLIWTLMIDKRILDDTELGWSLAFVIAALRHGFNRPAKEPGRHR
jgi:AcrR family transcriptional regulator